MRRRVCSVLGGTATLALLAATVSTPATAAPPAADRDSGDAPPARSATKPHERPHQLAEKKRALQERALELVLSGKREVRSRGGSKSVRVAPGQWVQYEVEDSDQILSFLIEFGDGRQSADGSGCPGPVGPLHNQIEKPDRSVDNTTYWIEDFDRQHYLDMFFNGLPDQNGESLRDFYQEQSSGRYTVGGDVSNWVQVPNREACYGESESNVAMTQFIQDAADAWTARQKTEGSTEAEIKEYLSRFDQWDRYDHDGDGDFEEPDGYIDHFQAIHAGEGEEAGAPSWTIWSHRWYVGIAGQGSSGPEGNKLGGVEIGDTGYWIGDYTTEPENGGLGVFAHEFAHDLGLPDEYDTAGGENGTGFWTLMSSGSWLGHGKDTIGTTPGHMSAWDKLQLGWLDYEVARAGQKSTHKLGVAEHATKKAQALITLLPPKTVTTDLGIEAAEGEQYLYSGTGDDRTATATSPSFTVPEGGQLAAQVNYEIESDWDYAYAEVSTDGGETFTPVETNRSTHCDPAQQPNDCNPNGQNDGYGITGDTGGDWVDLTADLSRYAGQEVQLRFRMANDAAVHGMGFLVDDIRVGDALTVEDGAPDWELNEFIATDGTYSNEYEHYYIAENRQYVGYDTTLRQGPYNFGWTITTPNRVEHFPYQNGLVVWYWDTAYSDNNTSQHPGHGLILPVDAHPDALKWSDGTVARNRIQTFDASFGTQRTDPISLHREVADDNGVVSTTTLRVPAQRANRVFDDSVPMRYYDPDNPSGSVIVGNTDTQIRVVNSNRNGMMTVQVR